MLSNYLILHTDYIHLYVTLMQKRVNDFAKHLETTHQNKISTTK